MHNRILFWLFFILAQGITTSNAQVSDALVLSLMEEYDVPGLSLAIVSGNTVSTRAWGWADAKATRPITPETPFRIASVAKTLVAAAVLKSAYEGIVRLNEDVSFLIPAQGPFSGSVTLHNLLTHTGGFDERLVGYGARTQEEMIPLGEYLAKRMPARGWPVGEQISYSNHGMSLAAFVLEHVQNKPFSEIASSTVFKPLGMSATTFISGDAAIPSNAADPLSCSDGRCETLPHVFSHAYPAGLAFSTAPDMARFISAILKSAGSPPETEPLQELIPERFTHDSRIPGMSYGFFNQYHGTTRALAHAGSVPGYWSLLMVLPEADFGFFFSTNGGKSGFGERLRDVLLSTYLGKAEYSIPVEHISEDVASRAGVYELTRYSHDTIERFPQVFANSIHVLAEDNVLELVSGGRTRRYVQVADALYENKDGSDRIAFGVLRGKSHLFRSSSVYGAAMSVSYEKQAFYREPRFLNEYVSWLLAGPLLLYFAIWPILAGIAYYLRRRRDEERSETFAISGAVTGLAVLNLLLFGYFGLGFTAKSNQLLQSGELFYGMPSSLSNLAVIPPIFTALSVVLMVACYFSWEQEWWNMPRRICFSFIAFVLAFQIAFLVEWNYLPIAW